MSRVKTFKRVLLAAALASCLAARGADPSMPGVSPVVSGARYATDAYPGFDDTEEMTKPERKEPKWFSFINGPNRATVAEQFAYCQELMDAGDHSKARKQLDALVREWPTSPEAPKAQQKLAEVCFYKLGDAIDAFSEYRYLLDFYSSQCDYGRMADMLYQVAGVMKIEGKEVMFVRFANTVDVRRAYETCVLRAPGAKWVPEAMMTIGALREEEGKYESAAKVYENLRNTHPDAKEAKAAVAREAEVRMILLREHGYNRSRCRDTINFLQLALRLCRPEDVETIRAYVGEARLQLESEAYLGAKFYDSTTRTRRSAISAYEKFLAEYPDSVHADAVRARLEELKGAEK